MPTDVCLCRTNFANTNTRRMRVYISNSPNDVRAVPIKSSAKRTRGRCLPGDSPFSFRRSDMCGDYALTATKWKCGMLSSISRIRAADCTPEDRDFGHLFLLPHRRFFYHEKAKIGVFFRSARRLCYILFCLPQSDALPADLRSPQTDCK